LVKISATKYIPEKLAEVKYILDVAAGNGAPEKLAEVE
jgi:hypothetical protein